MIKIPKIERSGVHFFDVHFVDRNISVVAVRGTNSALDALQDAYLWKEIAFLQISPLLLQIFPEEIALDVVSYLSWIARNVATDGEGWYESTDHIYYQKLDDYVASILDKREKVFLTGHSLGFLSFFWFFLK